MTDPCSFKKIIIGTSGLGNLTLFTSPVGERLCQRKPADYPIAGDRNATGGVSDKGNLNFPATFVWEPNALITATDKALADDYWYAYKQNSSRIFWLQDENERLRTTEASTHSRTLVPDSTITLGGRSSAFYVFNTYLTPETPDFAPYQGGDLWLFKGWKFIEVV
jgi:hypothetical protein